MSVVSFVLLIVGLLAMAGGVFLYIKSRQGSAALIKHDKEMEQKMYELAILKEIGDRTGYSLNIQNIVDIITGSLHQFMEYSAVSYMLLKPEKIIFKVHLEKSVSRHFLNDIQDRMLKSLSALLNKEFNKNQVEEILTGAILVDEFDQPVRSFFNIPLVIGETVVGVLTIADAKEGLYKEEETTILYKLTRQASQTVTRLQEVIETEQKKLNAMVESMNEGVVMTDKDYRIVVVNPAAKQAVRIGDKKDVSIFDFIDHLEGRFDIRGKLEESVKLDKVLSSQDVLLGDRVFQIFVSPVKSNIGLDKDQVIGGVVIFHDITKEKEIEKMKEDFISMMVHELRSPLNGIFMITQMMEKVKKVKDIKEYSRNVNLVMNSTDSMLRIVNDLLDAAKLESGKFEIHLAPADLAEMINDRVDFFSAQAKDSGLRLSAQVSQNFPKEVMLDAARIQQVLNNLISNSLKFTHEGGTVLVQAFEHVAGGDMAQEAKTAGIDWMVKNNTGAVILPGRSIVVAVTDSGQGIAKNNIPNLFNKFVQFQAKTVQKGTGLGLVISKGIVEAHKGLIGVASEEGIGTTFYFHLPLSQ